MNALSQQAQAVGVDADQLVRSLQRVTEGQVSLRNLTAASNKAIALLGRDAIPRFEELADVALRASQVMGTNVTQAFGDIVTGIGRQSRMILDNLGIIVDTEKAYRDFAISIGKTTEQLTENERKMAFLNATIEQGKKKFSDIEVILSGRAGVTAAMDNFQIAVGNSINKSGALNLVLIQLTKAISDTADGMDSFVGDSIALLIKGGVKAVVILNQMAEQAIAAAIGFTKASRAVVQLIPASQAATRRAVAEADERIAALEDTLVGLIGTEIDLLNLLDDIDQALAKSKEEIDKSTKSWDGLKNVAIDLPSVLDDIAAGLDDTTKAAGKLSLSFEGILAEMRKMEDATGVSGGLFGPKFKSGLEDFKAIGLGIDELGFRVPSQFTAFGRNIRDKFGQDALALAGGDGEVDPKLDIASLGLQFGQAITRAFQSSTVTNAIAQTLSAGVSFAASLSKAGAASGDPIIAGIALVAGLVDLFSGGNKPAPVITKPVDVRLVEITANAATKLLGVSQRQLIAAAAGFSRGIDARQQLRLQD